MAKDLGPAEYSQEDTYDAYEQTDAPTPGASDLSDLTDVDLTNPTDGQTLVYDAESEKWVNGNGSGGGSGVLICNVDPVTYALDKTWAEIANADYSVAKVTADTDAFYMLLIGYSAYSEQENTVYEVGFYSYMDSQAYGFVTDSPDGYPVVQTSNN